MTRHVSRRNVLHMGAAVGSVALLDAFLASSASAEPGSTVTGGFSSHYRQGTWTTWQVDYPAGHGPGSPLPVLITLHGTDGGSWTPTGLRFRTHSVQLAKEGRRPFVCVGVGGGNTWWHRRSNGNDSSAMVMYELLPVLAGLGLDVRRPALYGLSMGAYGAVLLASAHSDRLSSLAISSLPIPDRWDRYRGAFDSAQDFADHDIRQKWAGLAGLPVRVDIGTGDPFYVANTQMRPLARPQPEFYARAGGHDWTYWSTVALDQFRFAADRF